MKICSKCKAEKPVDEFYKDSRRKDGLQSQCKSCFADASAIYRANNKEKISERKSASYLLNRERVLSRVCAYKAANTNKVSACAANHYAANKEKYAARSAEYRLKNSLKLAEYDAARYKANPEKYAAYRRTRRARVRKAEGKHTAADIRSIFDNQRGLCANCKATLIKSGAKKYHVDHIMPLALGGSNWASNLQCLCPACNLSKGAKHPVEWAKKQGKLL